MTPYRPATSYDVAFSASSAASTNPVPDGITAVRLVADQDCYVTFAATPTAAAGSAMRLISKWPETFSIVHGQKIGVIRASADGTLTVTELTH